MVTLSTVVTLLSDLERTKQFIGAAIDKGTTLQDKMRYSPDGIHTAAEQEFSDAIASLRNYVGRILIWSDWHDQ